MIKLILLLFLFYNPNNDKDFIDSILMDGGRYSYYLCLQAYENDIPVDIVVQNGDLFSYFHTHNNIDGFNSYSIYVKKNNILSQRVLRFKSGEIRNCKIVSTSNSCDSITSKSSDILVAYYFNRLGGLKQDLSDNDVTCLIKRLFDYKIKTRIDDETGLLCVYP